MDQSRAAVLARLQPLLAAVHDALSAGVAVSHAVHTEHGWNPSADRHLDRQLVRREAMERLRPWSAPAAAGLQLELDLFDTSTDNLGLPMSGLILRTPTDVVRVWHSDDGELPAADSQALQAFYRQTPTTQTQLVLDGDRAPATACHLALLWADAGGAITRLELVRPWGHAGRRVQVDWRADLLAALRAPAG